MTEKRMALRGWTFAQVPIAAIVDTQISDGAKTLLALLAYRQGRDAAAWPSVGSMADDLGVTKRTIQNRLRELREHGYLEVERRPGRANLYALIASPQQQAGGAEGGRNELQGGMKLASGGDEAGFTQNDRTEQDTDTPTDSDERTPSQQMFGALAKTCSIDWRTCTSEQRGALNQSEKILRQAGAKPRDVLAFREWWDEYHWIGRDRQEPPKPHQVRENWGEYCEDRRKLDEMWGRA